MRKAIVWFKTDLRLHDNETLVNAIQNNDEVIPVYCFDKSHFKKTEFGFHKTGNYRTQFLLESLQNLDKQLRELGSGLVVLQGNPRNEIFAYAKKHGVQKVYAKKEVAYEEKFMEQLVEKELWNIQCTLETFSTSTLYRAEDLPFGIKDIPNVFTNFRKRIEAETTVRDIFKKPTRIKSPIIEPLSLPTLFETGLDEIKTDARQALNFKGGEEEGLKRVHYYFTESKCISNYKETRNGMIGGDYSSKFSAWLANGCLSPREIYYELKNFELTFGANDSTYWLVFELLWRDYFRFMMKKYRHQFFLKSGIQNKTEEAIEINTAALEHWINATTGIDFIDANMLELKLTGFMSNRGRQNVASYLINDLKIDWRYGAAYFEQQLIDYDVCSNWGNWAYLAGVGNDPRGNRYFNIAKQSNDYDKLNHYKNLWKQQL